MTRTMLSSLAAAAAFAMAATQWGGVAAAAKNSKPTEIVVVPYAGKGAAASRRGTGRRTFLWVVRRPPADLRRKTLKSGGKTRSNLKQLGLPSFGYENPNK